MLKSAFRVLVLPCMLSIGVTAPAFGQALVSTSLSAAVTDTDRQFPVASVSGISVGDVVYVDREAAVVVEVSGSSLFVSRGVGGSAASGHVSGSVVFAGPAARFFQADPVGSCVAGAQPSPYINVQGGRTWACVAGSWVELRSGAILCSSSTQAATGANTTETEFFSCELPAGVVAAAHSIRVLTYGSTAANANTKTVRVYFGSNVFTVIAGAVNNSVWYTTNYYHRTGASAQQRIGFAGFAGTVNAPTVATATESEAASILVRVTGQNGTAAANDIVFRAVCVEFLK